MLTSSQVVEVIERLEREYGRAEYAPRMAPMDELVSCILSQSTTDATSFPAFYRLRDAFPDWADLANAPADAIVPIIRPAGLPNQKAKGIQACLREIHRRVGDYTLENLRDVASPEARRWLESLPGVGPKTACITLCFAFGRDVIPVDTHIFRVSKRLGLLSDKCNEAKAHDELPLVVPMDFAYRYHTSIIQHGRKVCRAPKPKCGACVVRRLCLWYSRQTASDELGVEPK